MLKPRERDRKYRSRRIVVTHQGRFIHANARVPRKFDFFDGGVRQKCDGREND